MTKIITSICLLQLVEKGAIKLDEDLRSLLPDLAALQILKGFDADDKPIMEDNTRAITIR